jgi:hypothetical protein
MIPISFYGKGGTKFPKAAALESYESNGTFEIEIETHEHKGDFKEP